MIRINLLAPERTKAKPKAWARAALPRRPVRSRACC